MFHKKNTELEHSKAYRYYKALLDNREIITNRLNSNLRKYFNLNKMHTMLDRVQHSEHCSIMLMDLEQSEKKKLDACVDDIKRDIACLSDILEKIWREWHRIDSYFPEKYMFAEPSFGNETVLSILEGIVKEL